MMAERGVNSPNRTKSYTCTPKPTGQGHTPGGLVATETDPRGIETEYFYNTAGLVTEAENTTTSGTEVGRAGQGGGALVKIYRL